MNIMNYRPSTLAEVPDGDVAGQQLAPERAVARLGRFEGLGEVGKRCPVAIHELLKDDVDADIRGITWMLSGAPGRGCARPVESVRCALMVVKVDWALSVQLTGRALLASRLVISWCRGRSSAAASGINPW